MHFAKFVAIQFEPAIYPNGVYENNVKPIRKASALVILEVNGQNISCEMYKELRKLAYYRILSERFVSLLNDILKDKTILLNDDLSVDVSYFNDLVKELLRKVRVRKFYASK